MQKAVHSLASISFFFFIIFGALHISTSLLLAKGVNTDATIMIFNVLDLPFLFISLIYGSSKLSLTIENITGNLKVPVVVCSVLSLMIFLTALYFNFAYSDANLFG